MPIDHKLIDNLLKDYKTPEDILGENGLLKQLTKAVLERAMRAELTQHLGYEPHDSAGDNSGNSRNGKSRKTLKGDFGELPLEVPRDRDSSFEPKIVPKGQTRFDGFDDKILSLYARGMTTREIQAHLEEIYQVEVSPALHYTIARQHVELSPRDAERLRVTHGEMVTVSQNGTALKAPAHVRADVPAGTAFLAEGIAADSANVLTEQTIEVSKDP